MTTMTDDINPRLDALETGVQELRSEIRGIDNRLTTVEAEVRSTNVLLERMHTEQQEARREQQAENRAMREENRALTTRIDRLFLAIIGFGSGIIVTLLGVLLAIVLTG